MKLYKYRTVSKYTLQSIREQSLWMANPSTFNDPFDCQRLYDYYGDIDKNVTVYCMTDSYMNLLMWSHYADGHKGICIEYDFPNRFPFCFDNLSYPFFPVCKPVCYVDKMPDLEKIPLYGMLLEDKKRLLEKYIFTKDAKWAYEKEWRLAIFLENLEQKDHKLKLPPNTITAIYLGCNISEKEKENLYKSIKHMEVGLYQMEKISDSYSLKANVLPEQRPWTWEWLNEREKELARRIDEYLGGIGGMIDPENEQLISQIMSDLDANPAEEEFVIDRIWVNRHIQNALDNSDITIKQTKSL